MPKILREYPWKISYTSNTHNTITDFYIPALECAIQYDRKAGFFSSAILTYIPHFKLKYKEITAKIKAKNQAN